MKMAKFIAGLVVTLLTGPANFLRAEDGEVKSREAMVRNQLVAGGIRNPEVLQAMMEVPRHEFVPASLRSYAYTDGPLPIGHGQTISQPFIVAFMTQALELTKQQSVLEVGTGSGYQAAILGKLAKEVYSIEIVPPLAESAKGVLSRLGFENVHVRLGDGYLGWPERAPFDAIIVTCAPDHVPDPLISQLKEGGGWSYRLVRRAVSSNSFCSGKGTARFPRRRCWMSVLSR